MKFAFAADFATYVHRNQIELPEALKNAECYSENLSESQGSPRGDCLFSNRNEIDDIGGIAGVSSAKELAAIPGLDQ